jgi:hypothetical protein
MSNPGMDSDRVAALVLGQIDAYQYAPPSGLTGNPFPVSKVRGYIERLRQSLVAPYVQRFELRETADQIGSGAPQYGDYWVVAEGDGGYLEWYDPRTGEFGLGLREHSALPISIGVRGDVVGVFIAM